MSLWRNLESVLNNEKEPMKEINLRKDIHVYTKPAWDRRDVDPKQDFAFIKQDTYHIVYIL